MELHSHVAQVQDQLVAAAALGDERTQQTATALATAAAPAMRLAILAAVSAAADEITSALLDSPGTPTVSVHLDGDELRVDVHSSVDQPEVAVTAEDADTSARISFRLSEALKTDIETAARRDSVSVNTWLIRAATRGLHVGGPGFGSGFGPGFGMGTDFTDPRGGHRGGGHPGRGGNSHRITGWING